MDTVMTQPKNIKIHDPQDRGSRKLKRLKKVISNLQKMLPEKRAWIRVTKWDEDADFLKEIIPQGRMITVNNNQAFFRPATQKDIDRVRVSAEYLEFFHIFDHDPSKNVIVERSTMAY